MKWTALLILSLITTMAFAGTTRKLMIEEPADYDTDCILGSQDTAMHIPGQTLGPIGTISSGSCNDSWTSGVNFGYGWETLTKKKVAGGCVKRYDMQINVNLDPGRAGFLDNFNATPTGATANPCLHTDGKTYRKYEADTDP